MPEGASRPAPMSHSISEIARATGLAAVGDTELRIRRPAPPGEAGSDELALAMSPGYAAALKRSAARAAVLWSGADWRDFGLAAALFAPRPRVALAALGELFAPAFDVAPGIHAAALVDSGAKLGEDCWVGPFAVIGPGARIGAGARIMAHVTIGRDAEIGADALIHPGVRIGPRVRVGARFIAQPNACIGADGFSFVTPEAGAVESARATGRIAPEALNLALRRINSLGSVVLGDDVEIGACTTVDRGTVADTTIGSGTKIDNQVQVGHNVRIGETCLICGQAGIAGSAVIGARVVLGGKAGVSDHVSVGADSILAGGCLAARDVPPRAIMMGAPAVPRERFLRELRALGRLPRLAAWLREFRRRREP